MTRPRFAVLGASGLIGRHVCEELRRRGHEPVALARDAVTDHQGAAICIHLAEPSTLASAADAEANLARARGVLAIPFERIVYASSAVVYGDAATTPRTEADATPAMGAYAAAKLATEVLFARDARCATARIANVYGRGMSPINVLSDVIAQLDQGGPIRLRDLAPVRDYIHATDVARALVDLAVSPLTGVTNIGTQVPTSVRDLARHACAAAGQPDREIVATAPRSGNSMLVLAIDRARDELGWTPSIALDRGVANLITEKAA